MLLLGMYLRPVCFLHRVCILVVKISWFVYARDLVHVLHLRLRGTRGVVRQHEPGRQGPPEVRCMEGGGFRIDESSFRGLET